MIQQLGHFHSDGKYHATNNFEEIYFLLVHKPQDQKILHTYPRLPTSLLWQRPTAFTP